MNLKAAILLTSAGEPGKPGHICTYGYPMSNESDEYYCLGCVAQPVVVPPYCLSRPRPRPHPRPALRRPALPCLTLPDRLIIPGEPLTPMCAPSFPTLLSFLLNRSYCTRMKLTPDGTFFIAVDDAGCIALFELKERSEKLQLNSTVPLPELLTSPLWSDEILVTRVELEERSHTVTDLQSKVEELKVREVLRGTVCVVCVWCGDMSVAGEGMVRGLFSGWLCGGTWPPTHGVLSPIIRHPPPPPPTHVPPPYSHAMPCSPYPPHRTNRTDRAPLSVLGQQRVPTEAQRNELQREVEVADGEVLARSRAVTTQTRGACVFVSFLRVLR